MSLRARLISGLLLLTLTSFVGTSFIVKNLSSFRHNQEMFTFKDAIFHEHHAALVMIQSAQSLLYQHKAGYTREIDVLVDDIVTLSDILHNIPRVYRENFNPTYCNSCHDNAEGKVTALADTIQEISRELDSYQDSISILITTSDVNAQVLHAGQANAIGESIIVKIRTINRSAGIMVDELLSTNLQLVEETTFAIRGAMLLIVFIALATMLYTIYAIYSLVSSLLRGTESIYRDDFTLRLPVGSRRDEFALLASRFNLMAEHLQRRDLQIADKTSQLEAANVELKDLNENLEGRIKERTSELEEMVHQLRETTVALEESKRRLETANVDLLKANQAKSNFLSIISHELKTPLSVINGFLSLILDERYQNDPGHLREAVEISRRRGQQLARMIDELIDLSRLDARSMILHRELIDVEAALNDVLEQFLEDCQRKQIAIKRTGCSSISPVFCDAGKFRQIFTNLLSNALKFSPDGSAITISCTEEREFILFTCRDNGIGIPEAEREKVFEKFYQVDSSATRRYGGAGLGLSIVREIIHLHGGKIWVESESGQGCTFFLTLPKTDSTSGSGDAEKDRPFPGTGAG